MNALKEWYFLKDGRLNFKPNVIRDQKLFFCHLDIEQRIESSIERDFALGEPIKMMLLGDWGVGKTHTVHHIAWWLKENKKKYPAETYLVEVGDVTKKSRFDILVSRFIDEIGNDRLVSLVHGYQAKEGGSLAKRLPDYGISRSVAEAFSKLLLVTPGETPPPQCLQAISYLKGQNVPGGTQIGLGERLVESQELYSVLAAIGRMVREVDGRQLLLIADEAAKLEAVSADDATEAHWTAVNRMIFDDNNENFGFIYTLSAKTRNSIPNILIDPQVENRLGIENYITLLNLHEDDVRGFLTNLIKEFVDFSSVKAAVESATIPKGNYSEDAYPFTTKGLEAFVEYWARDQENAKPRDITDRLNDAAFFAMKAGSRLIDESALKEAKIL